MTNTSHAPFTTKRHLLAYCTETPKLWLPYQTARDYYDQMSTNSTMIRLATQNIDPKKIAETCEQLGKPAETTGKDSIKYNARQSQSARAIVNTWCQSATNAPSVKLLYDHWGTKYPAIQLRQAVESEEKIKDISSSFSTLNTDMEGVVTSITQIAAQWSGQYGWRSVALQLAHELNQNPNNKDVKQKLTDLFEKELLPMLNSAVLVSSSAQKKAANFANKIGQAVSEVNTIETALSELYGSLKILHQGDLTSYNGMKSAEEALEKAVIGLGVGGLVTGGVGTLFLEMPPPFDFVGGCLIFGAVVSEIAAIGSCIAIAVLASKMSTLYSEISEENTDMAQCTHSQKVYSTLVKGGQQIEQYANSFDQAINNTVSDYQAVLQNVKSENPNGEFLIQKIGALDNLWTEVHNDGDTLKNLGIALENQKRVKAHQWIPNEYDTPMSYFNKVKAMSQN